VGTAGQRVLGLVDQLRGTVDEDRVGVSIGLVGLDREDGEVALRVLTVGLDVVLVDVDDGLHLRVFPTDG